MIVRRFSDKNIKPKKVIYILFFIIVCVIILTKSIYNYFEMKSRYDSINNEIKELREENIKLQSRVEKLYDDREYIEKVAREQLNLVKDGETVYIFTND
ncbi:MAG: septum formation initiator family protein [Candidatus Goldbacteria bacterium]|nr:septum formation initiator family protein [Candidatus Goldiibacteriota bacterium]